MTISKAMQVVMKLHIKQLNETFLVFVSTDD